MDVENVLELPGEANPLTENILIHVLKGAASSDQQQIQESTKQLQTWETQSSYFVHLQSAFVDRRLPLEIRWIAITQLKNGIDKYWRKTANNAVSKDDKDVIRSRLLDSGSSEGDPRLATANALVIAKVVRYEYPNTWPDVITQLISGLRTTSVAGSDPLYLHNILNITHRVVKELATGRLRSTKASLQSAAPELLRVVGELFALRLPMALAGVSSGDLEVSALVRYLSESVLAMKVARRLVIAGYEYPHRANEVVQLLDFVDAHFVNLFNLYLKPPSTIADSVKTLLGKQLVQFGKLYVELAQAHTVSFALMKSQARLSQCWQLIVEYGQAYGAKPAEFNRREVLAEDAGNERPALEKAVLKALLTIRACLRLLTNPQQVLKFKRDDLRDEESRSAKAILSQEVFTDSFAVETLQVLIRQYFVFKQTDLHEWEDEPDEWEKREDAEGEDFETSVKSCAEKLFLDVAINYKEVTMPPLIEGFRHVIRQDNAQVLFKDSIYTAIGLAAPVLNDQLDFDSFISSTLVADIQSRLPGSKILRRRVSILLGQWVPIKLHENKRPVVYEIFRFLLDPADPNNDEIVRVSAGRQFQKVIDGWGFQPEQFLTFAPDILSRLMALIEEVDLPETKLTLLNTISVIVERLEQHITPFADRIVSILPPLWEQSGDEHLMKQAILAILARLFTSMGGAGSEYHHLALPIIAGAVAPGSDTQLYLLDDALDLWHSILQQTPSSNSAEGIDPNLLEMIRFLIPTLELGSDALRKAIEITGSYILLAPSAILQSQTLDPLLASLASLLATVKPDVSGHVTNVVENLILATQVGVTGGAKAIRELVSSLVSSRFFVGVVGGLRGSWEAHQTTGPKAVVNRIEGVVETDYFALLARLVYVAPETVLEALNADAAAIRLSGTAAGYEDAQNQDMAAANIMPWLLEEWFAHTEDVHEPSRRKLMCIGLTRLLALHHPFILSRLQSLMSMWTDVITELTEGQDSRAVDCLVYAPLPRSSSSASGINPPSQTDPPPWEGNPYPSPEDERRKAMDHADPVHRVNLIDVVREALLSCVRRCGGEPAFQEQWLVNVDKDVVAGFQALGIL